MITHYEILNIVAEYKVLATMLHGDMLHGKSLVTKDSTVNARNPGQSFLNISDTKWLRHRWMVYF